jgi:D-glycero-D-manno-heptose 1,7-bisphosphate phosphatase
MLPLIILDRDGVINHDSEEYIKSPEEWLPIPGSLAAIALFTAHNIPVAVATNQSGLARGYYTEDTLQAIHQKMLTMVENLGGKIEYIAYCPHGPNDNCLCRKPKPGLIQACLDKWHVPANTVPVVGDSYRDIEAAFALGCCPILVKTGNGLKTLQKHPELQKKIPVFDDLAAVANHFCSD